MGRKARQKWVQRVAAMQPPAWTPFYDCVVETDKYPPGQAPALIYRNSRYTVAIWKDPPIPGAGEEGCEPVWPAMVHLSIKRNDREPLRDWRDLQRIKNEIVGPDHEAVELYPAEARLVDAANQYHLFIPVNDKGGPVRFPFGFKERLVSDDTAKTGGHMDGAKQRRFEQRPADAVSAVEIQRRWDRLTRAGERATRENRLQRFGDDFPTEAVTGAFENGEVPE